LRFTVKDKVFKIISENPDGIPQSTIHKVLGISKSRVCEVLKELESEGVIVRVKVGNQYIVKPRVKVYTSPLNVKTLKLGIVWSSEYPFITPFAKMLREKMNVNLEVIVYPSALKATWALANGEVDLALSPLITQLYAYSLTKSLKIISGGAYGGAAIVENKGASDDKIASSELSTMDMFRVIVVKNKLVLPSSTTYFSTPDDAIKLIRCGDVRYFVVWHPLIETLTLHYGLKVIVEGKELGLNYCCTLAASTKLDRRLRERIAKVYRDAIEKFTKSPERWIEWYSIKVGIPVDIVKRGLKHYSFRPYLDLKLIIDMLRSADIEMPSRVTVLNAIE